MRQVLWLEVTPCLLGAAAAVGSKSSKAGQKDSLTGLLLFFPYDAKDHFYWTPEFIIQVEQKKAGLKMDIEPN